MTISEKQTPAALGYRMPAEWEPHFATWLSWPRADGISFPDSYDRVIPALAQMVDALKNSERVHINVANHEVESEVRAQLKAHGAAMDHVRFFHIPTNEPWCRDHGPIFLKRDGRDESDQRNSQNENLDADSSASENFANDELSPMAIVDWDYNAWGGKYPPFDLDDVVPTRVGEQLGLPVFYPRIVMEGGSLDVNGAGTLLTTTSCLLNPNRNPDFSQAQIEQKLRDFLGVRQILWLGDGIEGDDTDGHIDDITRFVSRDTVVTVVEPNRADANHEPLVANREKLRAMRLHDGTPLTVIELPMPARIEREGLRLPASYANFYIANKVVLLPIFNDANDERAISILQKVFPQRRIVGIDCRELIWGLGAFHCLTQQQPQ